MKRETFHRAFWDPVKKAMTSRPVAATRVSEHFCFHDHRLSHIPSGYGVPGSEARTLKRAKEIAAALEGLPFIDWSQRGSALGAALTTLTKKQKQRLISAAAPLGWVS